MMKLRTTLAGVAIGLLLAAPAGAIGNGVPDGNGHPNVGILLFEEEGQPAVFCSGSLIAPQVFLTAGHCIEAVKRIGASNIWVSFDSTFDPEASPRIPASSFRTHPLFNPATGNLFNDLGVVLLSRRAGVAPVALPPANLLGDMKEAGTIDDQTFTNVGYGLVPHHKEGPPSFSFDGVRRVSTSPYAGLTLDFLHLLQNVDATGEGGVCFGDSGSPKFLGSSNMIVAVTSWGDAVCRASGFSPRLDIPSARAFLDDYVTPLP
jgi:secreted trypsin-like serine protease